MSPRPNFSSDLFTDVRYAARQLFHAPGFAFTVVFTLALCVGANLGVFQLLYGVLFAPLPISHPQELYSLEAAKSPFDAQTFLSYSAYRNLRHSSLGNAQDAAQVIARSGISRTVIQRNGDAASGARIDTQLVSDNFFSVLGLSPAVGRFFLDGDDESLAPQLPVVVRYGYWKQELGADPAVIGTRIVLSGIPAVIVGVAPERFSGVVAGEAPDLWLPLSAQSSGQFESWFDSLGPGHGVELEKPWNKQPAIYWLWTLARVPDAQKFQSAALWTAILQPDLALLATLTKDPLEREKILRSNVKLISSANGEGPFRSRYSQPLTVLMAIVGVVFLIGCLNLANLQLARLLNRSREFAVRASLGASRFRILRQLSVEVGLWILLSILPACWIASLTSSLLLRWVSPQGRLIPLNLHVTFQFACFAAALLLVSWLLFIVIPAFQIGRRDLVSATRSKSTSGGSQSRKGAAFLLAAQVSFSLLLLGVAALFSQTLVNISHIDAGLDREHIVSVHLDYSNSKTPESALPAIYARAVDAIQQIPGVVGAAVTMCSPPGCIWNTAIHVAGHTEIPDNQLHGEENRVGPGYFHAMGIPILRGREFDKTDTPDSPRVAILSQSFARKLFGNEDPIGHRVGYEPAPNDSEYVVIGEVGDARVDDLRSAAPPIAYFPLTQRPMLAGTIEVRTLGPVEKLFPAIRARFSGAGPDLLITRMTPLQAEYDAGLSREKLLARLTGIFAFLVLLLAALGFYGLLSFHVARRTAEIGVRVAVGATPSDVRSLILRQAFGILAIGVLPGIVFLELTGLAVRNLLYGVGAVNLAPVFAAVAVLIGVAFLAALGPARRAARVDPIEALRSE
ncbi:MAG TPA: ADOP family duplicated permease [Candidatus Acidoferrum sp.]|jgi:predicted permease